MKTKNDALGSLSCQELSGVGKRISDRLANLGIYSVQDLLFHFPFRYQDRTRISPIKYLFPGNYAVVEGEIESVSFPKIGKTRLLCGLRDLTGHLHLRFFYMNYNQRLSLKPGVRMRCYGEIRIGRHGLEMVHPEYKIITHHEPIPVEEALTPIYPTTEGLSQQTFRRLTFQALSMLENNLALPEFIPTKLLAHFDLPPLKDALQFVHRPPMGAPVEILAEGKHVSQRRFIFEELLAHRLALLHLKKNFQSNKSISLKPTYLLINQFLSNLTFQLTASQKKVFQEIKEDMMRESPMLRLVQGDVGSGKTVIAALTILQAIENGYQAALLAPTELLAEQHYQTLKNWFEPLYVRVTFLSGQMKKSLKNEALKSIASGESHIVLGTHAIFQKTVQFSNLALIVVDEQHRFGVEQRLQLRDKGLNEDILPHQLVMTATPIPRTLAMSMYADLDCSVIDELPPGRTPVITRVVSENKRSDVIEHIHRACMSGKQAYWVCTLIEESEVLSCKAAEETAIELKNLLPQLRIGLIHGRMKASEKETVMAAFRKNELHLLVATTVIEVGVDVPNASLMVIENAERLGLAQLHQLRGRIGRGKEASYCLLMYKNPLSKIAKERLKIMREHTDGFQIAQRDLELRGPGEVLGIRQTGEVSLRIANLIRDEEVLSCVQQAATMMLEEHPHFISPLIKRWLGQNDRYGHV